MEVTERNSNVRDASFELLLQLAELEQLVYAAHYDNDPVAGNPRVGWVTVGLIGDLSVTCSAEVVAAAGDLHGVWSRNWATMPDSRADTDELVEAIDAVREAVRQVLLSLE